jgi:hypothetical protein
MIDGCQSFKVETLKYHKQSRAHRFAVDIHINTVKEPSKAPASHALSKLEKETEHKMEILFRNTHAVAKNNSFKDFIWLCELDEAKGLSIGKTYRNPKAAKTFCSTDDITTAHFLSLTMDGSTDAGIVEQESVFARSEKNKKNSFSTGFLSAIFVLQQTHNYSGKCVNDRKVTLHRFPVNKRLSMLWTNRMSRKNWKPTSCSRLCSEHFITKVGPTKEHPIPSIFDHKIFKTTNVSVCDVFSIFLNLFALRSFYF